MPVDSDVKTVGSCIDVESLHLAIVQNPIAPSVLSSLIRSAETVFFYSSQAFFPSQKEEGNSHIRNSNVASKNDTGPVLPFLF